MYARKIVLFLSDHRRTETAAKRTAKEKSDEEKAICLPAPQVTLFAMCLIHLDAVSRYRIDELRSSDDIMLTPCDGSYLTVGLVQCV